MWVYEVNTGNLFLRGSGGELKLVATCYSGAKACLNASDMDHVKSCGPIPKGRYTLRRQGHPRFASPAFFCDPTVEQARALKSTGRSGFWVHGDNAKVNFSASSGCIIANRITRQFIAHTIERTGDDLLEVVARVSPEKVMRAV